jgi:hypothetical protein
MKATDAHIAIAKRLLDQERVDCKGDERRAAMRTLEKIFFELGPLIGTQGVIGLFGRSVVLAKSDCPSLEGLTISGTSIDSVVKQCRVHFKSISLAALTESATAVCSVFVALTMTFIGERLTLQLLRNAWPTIDLTKVPK